MDFTDLGKMLLLTGGLVVLTGLVLLVMGRVPFLGRLPGDITFRRGNVSCYVPIVSSVLLSILLTFVLSLLFRWWGR